MYEERRRVRTHWVLRERYRRAATIAAVTCGLLVLAPLALFLAGVGAPALTSPRLLVTSLLVLAAAILVPYQLILSVGRRQWRRAR